VTNQASILTNIYKLYFIQAIRWALFYMPIFILFLQENGLSMQQILTLQAIFSIAIILFEIPSGYLSDTLGRKKTMVIGSVLSLIGVCIYLVAQGFFDFLIAELFLGFGVSFISGTDSALLYDTLKEAGKEKLYKSKEAVMQSVASFSESLSSIIGGFIAIYSLRTTFVPYAILLVVAIFISLTIQEPKRQKNDSTLNAWQEVIKITKYCIKDHKEVAALIFYAGLIMASTLTMVFFIQPYFELIDLPLGLFGIVWAALNFSITIFALMAVKYELTLGRKNSLASLIFLTIIGYLGVAVFQSFWAIGFIFLFYFVRAVSGPILKDYVNVHLDSNIRATALSVKHLVGRLIFTIFAPFIGFITDIYSLQTAFLVSAVFFTLTGSISLLYLKKHNAL